MKKIRFIITLLLTKLIALGMKLLHRQASYLPGKIALKLCPDFLGHMGRAKTVIAVTGTNGKTTVSNLLTGILRSNGYSVTNNSAGSNVDAGIASALIENSTLSGKSKNDIAVLEVDERSSPRIYPYYAPDYLVCNNIMRDSIKRNANTEFISYIISSALPASTVMLLNGDDIICSALGSKDNKKLYFGVEHLFGTEYYTHPGDVRDISYCPDCGAELVFDYTRYNHIGHVHCPKCGFKNAPLDYSAVKVDAGTKKLTVSVKGTEYDFRLINDNIANIYNTTGAIGVLTELGLTPEQIEKGLQEMKIVSSRFDRVEHNGIPITLQLAKSQNPIACSRSVDYARRSPGHNKSVIIIIDDIHENVNNTENIGWLFDCSYAPLADPSIRQVIIGGPRRHDHVVRCLFDGVDTAKVQTVEDIYDTAVLVDAASCDAVFIMYDLYLVKDARTIMNSVIEKLKEAGR